VFMNESNNATVAIETSARRVRDQDNNLKPTKIPTIL
jgi:hypothetical protein